MLPKIIEFSAKNKFLVFIMVIFLSAWGIWALYNTPLDAIPDLSDAQVIIFTEWPGRSPDLVEDQITYPIISSMLSAPRVRVVRGKSFLGLSFVYVIFEDGTDIYWARSRVLEYLQTVSGKLPSEVTPELGPDATGVGWGFQYALVDETGKQDLAQLRTLQDWSLKYAIESVPGVSEVASVGGFVKQYQITVDPNRLVAYQLSLKRIMDAVRRSNRDVAGRVVEWSGREYMVRGRGYIKNRLDIEKIVVGTDGKGTPILLRDIATVQLGPEIRRGLADLDGKGEVVGGIVVVRFGENVLNVIERTKEKLKAIEPSLPEGVKIVTTYDRSELIYRSVDTLRNKIITLAVMVSAVCIVFLFHLPSALVVILTLPIAILISFICMFYLRISSNIMSLGGIAIAIGAMVDASIIMVENAHKKIEEWEKEGMQGSRTDVIIDAAKEVGPSLFFSLLVITVGFLPIFALEDQAGRLFKPLAYTKTFSMLFASFLAITLTPVLMTLFIRGKVRHEEDNPISHFLRKIYHPVAEFALRYRKLVIVAAIGIMGITVIPFMMLGKEFMPALYEGTFFFMPSGLPGSSITTVSQILQVQDRIFKEFPEVDLVFGKAGRAKTATDPAPLEMYETVINLKPENEWRPQFTNWMELRDALDEAVTIPGVGNYWTMPIIGRIEMLSTGLRSPVGLKIYGPRLDAIERIGMEVEKILAQEVPGTKSAFADRVNTGYFLDITVNRDAIARYGLTIEDVQEVIQSAIGGMNLTMTVEGRERYPVNLRYGRELRDDIDKLKRVLVPAMNGKQQVPLEQVADIRITKGPMMMQSEDGTLVAYVTLHIAGDDYGGYVKQASRILQERVKLPPGYTIKWSGQYEHMESVREKLFYVIPFTLLIIIVLIFMNTKSWTKTAIVLLAVPFSLVGAVWLLYLLGYHLSTAVWVGVIALAGLDAETGIVMLLYLDLAYTRWKREGRIRSLIDIEEAVMEGAVKRIRPKIMTVSVILAGLIPIMLSTGTGSDVMKRIAAPMVGGVITSAILELIIYPAIYVIWRERELKRGATGPG